MSQEDRIEVLKKALTKAKVFMTYARYELEPKHVPYEQFPCQECCDKYLSIVEDALKA